MRRAWYRFSRTNRVLVAVSLLVLCALPWYRVNLTGSAPRGVWRLSQLPTLIERGMWVVLPVPASMQSLAHRYGSFLKAVAAVAGDRVCVEQSTLWIIVQRDTPLEHGMNYGPVYQTWQGAPLPNLDEGCFVVAEGQVFLGSPIAQSLDSRYFGTVPVVSLTARAFPVLTWR